VLRQAEQVQREGRERRPESELPPQVRELMEHVGRLTERVERLEGAVKELVERRR
jgi:hypothetical protein